MIRAALAGGREVMRVYAGEIAVELKDDRSPLTEADRRSHDAIVAILTEAAPHIPLLSEEGAHTAHGTRVAWDRYFLIDPLDGTKEFIKRNGEFTVNIALIEGNAPVMGVVHVPVAGKTYFAAKGSGAFLMKDAQVPEAIEATVCDLDAAGLRFVCSRSHLSPEVETYLKKFKDPQTLSMGSSLKFMLLAEGRADIYPRLAPTMEWDTAAAQLILEEAGGKVVDQESGEALRYNKQNLRNPYFIAYGRVD